MQQGPGGGKHLPPGLDPVTAGRWGLWLWGQRSHQRALKRTASASRVEGGGVSQRFVTMVAPWTVEEYPGRIRLLSSWFGVKASTAKDWLYRPQRLGAKRARMMARVCEDRAEAFRLLALDLERYAAEQDRRQRLVWRNLKPFQGGGEAAVRRARAR